MFSCVSNSHWVHTLFVTSLNSKRDFKTAHRGRSLASHWVHSSFQPHLYVSPHLKSEPVENKQTSATHPTLWAALAYKHAHTHRHSYKHTCTHLPATICPKHAHTYLRVYKRLSSNIHWMSAWRVQVWKETVWRHILSNLWVFLSFISALHPSPLTLAKTYFHASLFLTAPVFPPVTVFSSW